MEFWKKNGKGDLKGEDLERYEKRIEIWDKHLNRPWNRWRRDKLIGAWRDNIIKQENELDKKIRESKELCITSLLMFSSVYILEDENGKEYTKERLSEMDHEDLIDLHLYYMGELKKDVGGVD